MKIAAYFKVIELLHFTQHFHKWIPSTTCYCRDIKILLVPGIILAILHITGPVYFVVLSQFRPYYELDIRSDTTGMVLGI